MLCVRTFLLHYPLFVALRHLTITASMLISTVFCPHYTNILEGTATPRFVLELVASSD